MPGEEGAYRLVGVTSINQSYVCGCALMDCGQEPTGKEQDVLKHEQETAVQIRKEGERSSRQREQHLAKAQW